ncbi:MAG: hypothetical protein R6W75_01790 [Smithellaceae bacterium]
MRKIFFNMIFLSFMVFVPATVMAEVDVKVRINIPLPPPIFFPAPPEVVVIPETYVYAVPDVDVDVFFYDGWWWRPWEGRWYRSRHHDRGWDYYDRVPSFYTHVPPGWRKNYRDRRWKGHQWDQRRLPHGYVERNWQDWEKRRHWERDQHWGVRGMERRPQGRQDTYRKQGPPPRQAGPQGRPGKDKRYKDRSGRDNRR